MSLSNHRTNAKLSQEKLTSPDTAGQKALLDEQLKALTRDLSLDTRGPRFVSGELFVQAPGPQAQPPAPRPVPKPNDPLKGPEPAAELNTAPTRVNPIITKYDPSRIVLKNDGSQLDAALKLIKDNSSLYTGHVIQIPQLNKPGSEPLAVAVPIGIVPAAATLSEMKVVDTLANLPDGIKEEITRSLHKHYQNGASAKNFPVRVIEMKMDLPGGGTATNYMLIITAKENKEPIKIVATDIGKVRSGGAERDFRDEFDIRPTPRQEPYRVIADFRSATPQFDMNTMYVESGKVPSDPTQKAAYETAQKIKPGYTGLVMYGTDGSGTHFAIPYGGKKVNAGGVEFLSPREAEQEANIAVALEKRYPGKAHRDMQYMVVRMPLQDSRKVEYGVIMMDRQGFAQEFAYDLVHNERPRDYQTETYDRSRVISLRPEVHAGPAITAVTEQWSPQLSVDLGRSVQVGTATEYPLTFKTEKADGSDGSIRLEAVLTVNQDETSSFRAKDPAQEAAVQALAKRYVVELNDKKLPNLKIWNPPTIGNLPSLGLKPLEPGPNSKFFEVTINDVDGKPLPVAKLEIGGAPPNETKQSFTPLSDELKPLFDAIRPSDNWVVEIEGKGKDATLKKFGWYDQKALYRLEDVGGNKVATKIYPMEFTGGPSPMRGYIHVGADGKNTPIFDLFGKELARPQESAPFFQEYQARLEKLLKEFKVEITVKDGKPQLSADKSRSEGQYLRSPVALNLQALSAGGEIKPLTVAFDSLLPPGFKGSVTSMSPPGQLSYFGTYATAPFSVTVLDESGKPTTHSGTFRLKPVGNKYAVDGIKFMPSENAARHTEDGYIPLRAP